MSKTILASALVALVFAAGPAMARHRHLYFNYHRGIPHPESGPHHRSHHKSYHHRGGHGGTHHGERYGKSRP